MIVQEHLKNLNAPINLFLENYRQKSSWCWRLRCCRKSATWSWRRPSRGGCTSTRISWEISASLRDFRLSFQVRMKKMSRVFLSLTSWFQFFFHFQAGFFLGLVHPANLHQFLHEQSWALLSLDASLEIFLNSLSESTNVKLRLFFVYQA